MVVPLLRIVIPLAVFSMLFGFYPTNYLLFHSIIEMICVVLAGAIFMLSWHARRYIGSSYFAILGAGYLAVAILDVAHALSYPGMNVMPILHIDAEKQLWVAARLVESAAFLCATTFIFREANSYLLPVIATGTALTIASTVLVWDIFPAVTASGNGLTFFKVGSECLIIFLLLLSLQPLCSHRHIFGNRVMLMLFGAIWITIASEVAFTFHVTDDTLTNAAGHFLKLASIYLIYLAMVDTIRQQFLVTSDKVIPTGKKVGQTPLESEDRFRLLVDKIQGVFWIVSADLKEILYLSPGFEKIWQQPRQEMYDDPGRVPKTIHEKDRQRVMSAMAAATKLGWDLEFRILLPDGRVRWIRDRGYPVEDANGEIIQLCGMSHDITQQKRMEHRLVHAGQSLEQRVATRTKALSTLISYLKAQVSERSKIGVELKERNLMLKTLVQAIPDMVSYKDNRGRYLIANSAHRAFLGLTETSVIGRTDKEFAAIQAVKEGAEKERLAIRKGKAIRYESVLRSAAGCISHWDTRIVPVKNANDKLSGILTLARDISAFKQREFELQQSKALLQAFLNGISEPMLMIDNDLRPVYLNRAASTAYPLIHQNRDQNICKEVLCNESGQCERCRILSFMARGKAVSYERRPPESDRVEKVYLYPLYEKRNGLDGAVVRIADITEAKGLERHLIHSEKMNALGMLVAGMVHEINNPNSFITFNLPILRAYLEKIFLLLDSHPAAVASKDWFGMDYPGFRREIFNLADNLSHGSSRIDKIISNLKSMTHPRHGSNQRKWVDLFDVVDKAIMLCRGEIRKRVKVFEVKPPRRNIQIKTDPEALEQVVINLLINASHAVDKPESWVRIAAFTSEDAHHHAVIEVRDNGCGMPQETMKRIFDPFFTTKGPGIGTGLGLSVSYNLIRQLGGEILVDSKLDRGSRFRVVLPYKSNTAAREHRSSESAIRSDNLKHP